MKREVLDRWCERGILALVLCILVLGPLGLGAVRALEFSVIEGLTMGAMVLWALRLWLTPRPQLLWPPIAWAVLAFTLYAIGRYLTADIEYIARQEFLQVLVYAILFFVIISNLHRQETTQIISFTLIFLAMFIAFYALFQFMTGSNRVWNFVSLYPHRASGTYICPNHLAGFLEMILPLGLTYSLLGRVKPLTRIFLGYAALVILGGLVVTVSRGGWVAAGVSLLAFFVALLFQRTHRVPSLILLIALAAAAVALVPQSDVIQIRYKRIVTDEGKLNDDLRFSLWEPALHMWLDHPWFGVGPAHFDARFRSYRPEGLQLSPDRVHNDYLNTLTDWGVAGAVLVLSALVCLGVGVAKTWGWVRLNSRELGGKSGSNKFAFVLGSTLGLLALLIHSFIDFNMHIPANAILAVTLMALLSGHLRFASDRYWFRVRAGSKLVASVVLLGGVIYLAPQAKRQAIEFVYLEKAQRVPSYSSEQLAWLTQAYKIEPKNPDTVLAIGTAYRRQSQEGGASYDGQPGADYRSLARNAMDFFDLGMKLNPWDSRNPSGYGWCEDWLDRLKESEPFFAQAEALDPNNYFNVNQIGLHYVQLEDYASARSWFERSLRLEWNDNPIARSYLELINQRMLEAATNSLRLKLNSLPK